MLEFAFYEEIALIDTPATSTMSTKRCIPEIELGSPGLEARWPLNLSIITKDSHTSNSFRPFANNR
jgi:hypothetical protein